MTAEDRLEFLIEQVAELSNDAQIELIKALLTMRAQSLGVGDDEDATT